MSSNKTFLALILIILLSLTVAVWFYPPNGDFRVENPFWNGLSVLTDQTLAVPVSSISDLPESGAGTVLFMVPYLQYSFEELNQIRSYVSTGGTLILADDYGYGNQILDSFGLNVEFSGEALLDPLFNYRGKWLPKIVDFEDSAASANVSSVVFNHATVLEHVEDLDVIAYSSSFSFLDLDGDEAWSEGEPYGPFPVAATTSFGAGKLVVVSDPSFLINGVLSLDDNLLFTANLVSLGGNLEVYIDQSHLPQSPLDQTKAYLAVVYGLVATPLGTLTLIVLVLALTLIPFWKRREKP